MRTLTQEDIYPIRGYSAVKLEEWIKNGLIDASKDLEAAFFPLDSLLYFFDNRPTAFLEAVYRVFEESRHGLKFKRAVSRLVDNMPHLAQTPEGLTQCRALLPPLLYFVGKQNLNLSDQLMKLVMSPEIGGDDQLFLVIQETAVALSTRGETLKLLNWLISHERVKDHHIPLLLIALANCAPGRFSPSLRKAAPRLEKLVGTYPREMWPKLEAALRLRVGPDYLDRALLEDRKDRPSSQLAEQLGLAPKVSCKNIGIKLVSGRANASGINTSTHIRFELPQVTEMWEQKTRAIEKELASKYSAYLNTPASSSGMGAGHG